MYFAHLFVNLQQINPKITSIMKKTFLLFVLAALLPMGANAYLYYKNYDAYVDGIYYKLSGDEAKVTYEEDYVIPCYSGSVVIPSTITYEGKKSGWPSKTFSSPFQNVLESLLTKIP